MDLFWLMQLYFLFLLKIHMLLLFNTAIYYNVFKGNILDGSAVKFLRITG